MVYSIFADNIPCCYKEGEPPSLEEMSWSAIKSLATKEYNITEAESHSGRSVTEAAIKACHTTRAKSMYKPVEPIIKVSEVERFFNKMLRIIWGITLERPIVKVHENPPGVSVEWKFFGSKPPNEDDLAETTDLTLFVGDSTEATIMLYEDGRGTTTLSGSLQESQATLRDILSQFQVIGTIPPQAASSLDTHNVPEASRKSLPGDQEPPATEPLPD